MATICYFMSIIKRVWKGYICKSEKSTENKAHEFYHFQNPSITSIKCITIYVTGYPVKQFIVLQQKHL